MQKYKKLLLYPNYKSMSKHKSLYVVLQFLFSIFLKKVV
jgi:hypothetical protein